MSTENKLARDVAEKIRKLYGEHRDAMYIEAKSILKDHALAEDAVQQAVLKIIDKFAKFPDEDIDITRRFMKVVARNVAIDIYNTRKKRNAKCEYIDAVQNEETNSYSVGKTPCDELIAKESRNSLYKAIDNLPQKYRDVLLLEKLYNHSQKEIAEILNISYSAVKKRMERASKMLKEELRKEELV